MTSEDTFEDVKMLLVANQISTDSLVHAYYREGAAWRNNVEAFGRAGINEFRLLAFVQHEGMLTTAMCVPIRQCHGENYMLI